MINIAQKKREEGAFTLLELLIAITIIALLAGVAFPAYNHVVGMAKRANGMANVRSIILGLRSYSSDYGGDFPSTRGSSGDRISTSNDAFREIIDYVDRDERIFVMSGSGWGRRADLNTSTPEQVLKPGENHFAYIAGLNSISRGLWPIVVDGTDGSGTYSRVQGDRGGIWGGRYAVVGRVDGSAKAVPLKGGEERPYLPKHDDPDANALNVASYMGSGAELLDPDGLD